MADVPQDEVVFLILHYLRNLNSLPPDVDEATGKLETALVQTGLLPTLFDYAGGERVLSYEECASKLPNIEPSYIADALAERLQKAQIPVKTLFSNALLANKPSATSKTPNKSFRRQSIDYNQPSNYSVSAYQKKFSTNLTNVHALLNQMHEVERPLPLRNIMYAILPKAMQRQKRVIGHHQPVYCAMYDCFGDYIVTGSDDHQLKVWSARNAYLCHTLRGHDREINDITADPSRRILVSASRDSSIRVWDLVTGENKHVLKSGTKGVNCVLFSPCPDRPYLLSGSEDGIARLWNSRNFENICVNIPLPSKRINPRGQTFADSGSIRRMGATVGDSFPAQSPTGTAAESIPASSPSRMSSPPPPVPLANVHDNEDTSGNPPNPTDSNSSAPPVIVHSRNDGRRAGNGGGSVAANNNFNINSVNTQTARTPALQGSTQSRGAVGGWRLGSRTSNVPDPRQTSGPVAGAPHAMQQRNPGNPSEELTAAQNNNNNNNNSMVSSSPSCQVLSVAFNAGATRLAISGTDCMTHVYSITKESTLGNLPSVQLLTTLRGHSEKITQVLFAHHGDRLCTASADGTAKIYRRSTAKVPRKKKTNKTGAINLAGAGSWKSLLLDCRHHHSEGPSLSNAGGAASTSITPRVPRGRIPSSVNAVMWSLRDDYVVTASSNGKVRVWDSQFGRLLHVLDAHTGEVYIMDTHPFDERVIFTAGYDGKCILWDIEKGIELRRFFTDNGSEWGNQHPQVINGRFSPDGMSFIVTDTLGALSIFGIGSSDGMLLAPEEQFFANDIIPFRKNAQHRAISQENGQLLHLIPRGELCDSQLRKYALEIQLHSRDFYRNLPGARIPVVEEEASKSVANARNAKGEEFRLNQEKEEHRLVRAAIEEKRRQARVRKKAELDRDLLPVRSMKDFVVPDSEKDSDGDVEFKLEGTPSDIEMQLYNDDDDSSVASEEYRRPKRKRGRRKRIRKQSSKDWGCTCPQDCGPNMDADMSDDNSHDGSDESFRVASDDERSDASGESIRRKKSKGPRRSFAMMNYPSAGASALPRMQIHLNRAELSQPANGHSLSRNSIPEARRSPGRSLTSERRPDTDEVEDKILPQEEEPLVPAFSRASSSNFPNAMTTKSNPAPGVSGQWSVQSAGRNVEIPSTEVPTNSIHRRRRSPRNKSKKEQEGEEQEAHDDDEDMNVISKDELDFLGNRTYDDDDPSPRRGRRRHRNRRRTCHGKRVRRISRRNRNATMKHDESCPVHSDHGRKLDSESEDSEECNIVRRKRRKRDRRFERDASVEDSPVETSPLSKGPDWTLLGSEWLRGTSEKYNYIPQRGDSVVYYPIGHSAAIAKSKEIGIDPFNVAHESSSKKQRLNGTALEGKTGPLRFTISAISHEFPKVLAPKKRDNFCRRTVALLTLRRNQTDNWPSSVPNEVTLTYFPLDDIPEYLVLSTRVSAAIANNWKPSDRFRMLFVNEQRVWSYYSGVVVKAAKGFPDFGWNSVQVMYDNEDDPDKGSTDLVSPWELEPVNISTSKSCRPITPHTKPSMFLAIANEIHHLQSTDDVFKSSVSWLDTIMKLVANVDYCRKVALPMDLPLILMRLCTTYYRHYDAFLDDVGLLKENAMKFNGKKSEAATMATKVCDIIIKVSQKTKMVMTSSTTPPIPGHPGNSASSRPVKPRTPDSAQTSYVGNMYANTGRETGRGPVNPHIVPISIPPRLPSVGYLHPSNSMPGQTSIYQHQQYQHMPHHLRPVMPRLPIPSVPIIPPGSAQASNDGVANTVIPLNMAAIRSPSSRMNNTTQQIISPVNGSATLPPISATNYQQHIRHGNTVGINHGRGNRLPTRSAQSVEAAGGGHFGQFGGQATTSESRVPFYSPTMPAVPPIVGHQSGSSSHAVPYQENSRHEHSTISIAAASTMSCAGENANIGESPENRR